MPFESYEPEAPKEVQKKPDEAKKRSALMESIMGRNEGPQKESQVDEELNEGMKEFVKMLGNFIKTMNDFTKTKGKGSTFQYLSYSAKNGNLVYEITDTVKGKKLLTISFDPKNNTLMFKATDEVKGEIKKAGEGKVLAKIQGKKDKSPTPIVFDEKFKTIEITDPKSGKKVTLELDKIFSLNAPAIKKMRNLFE